MFRRNHQGVYESGLLEALPWVLHGFGSRHADGWPGAYTYLKQIHSDIVAVAEGCSGCLGHGDALVTAEPGRLVGVRTADCIPVLIAGARTRVVAAVHAGWRGIVQRVAPKAVYRMCENFGADPGELVAAIGPGAGVCCYEVGPEVGEQFRPIFPDIQDLSRVDLAQAIRRQLAAAGVPDHQIDIAALCTICGPSEFHSWRRDRDRSGRMVAAIGIRR
ncbi:MAG: peptidoglycan editing factor PgeF [Acidobacteria bacterium]|nr:peptidoglycan editing factor PgeF [Acidobacteriota bacterium]MBI3280272.1 peptidoglycan editing factor PgeF [Acidobacteriota bacterium]